MAKFYDSVAWQRMRRQVLRDSDYTCWRCGDSLHGHGAHVHHRTPLKEDPERALDRHNLIALCDVCHSVVHADDKHHGFDRGVNVDGTPTSPDHPWNKAKP